MEPSEEQFFQQGEQAPEEPSELQEGPFHADELALSGFGLGPEASARRARLKWVVGGALVGGLALFGLGLVRHFGAQFSFGAKQGDRQATLSASLPAKSTAGAASNGTLTSALPTPSAEPVALDGNGAAGPTPSIDTEALIRRARSLLEAGHLRDGVAAARSAVGANPRNAEPYILLAAGLQDLGRWGEAQSVFATCKQATSTGPNATCSYFASIRAGIGN